MPIRHGSTRPIVLAAIALVPVLCGVLSIFVPKVASACSCMASPGALPAARDAAHVFEGRPVAVEVRADPPPPGVNPKYASRYRYFQFTVARRWKGDAGETITVKTALDSAGCGIDYELGVDYLVYASEYDGQATASLCSRTRRSDSDQARADVVALDAADGDFSGAPAEPTPTHDEIGPADAEPPSTSPEPRAPSVGDGEPEPIPSDGRGCSLGDASHGRWATLLLGLPVLAWSRRRRRG